jgi:hypothetical protein
VGSYTYNDKRVNLPVAGGRLWGIMVAVMNAAIKSTVDFGPEIATYNKKLPELLGEVGKFIMIKGDEVIDIFETYNDAVKAGYERFKLEPFFVKQIAPAEQVQFFSRDLAFT